MTDQLKENVKRRGIWLRLLYMIVLAVAFHVAEFVICVVVVFQFLTSLLTGEPNAQLLNLGRAVGVYLRDIVAFLTFATEDKPYPFAPWPDGAETAKPKPAKAKRTRKPPAKKGDA
jgi:hypothetical protein